ncbi:oxygen-independent coproporphyrinogen III oxidase [Dasania sp. GY-MA-18]|uniref:Coproporphyrinogen-III oxidase n=1 Tax=Dasania phycosphaerae TaxID=2950436 RepID=A0A9J6RPI7_9GAMM|nr:MULTISPECIES: oxygen-independent coproporphyrinogen III oxidase [Dasania]MCR8923654.1 oxygen-independent coproporphyrinogen III oxidase [Dasania sp. GY-MA-18]MCZ0866088.1 oxygen-independent coproporphyrinogen III oxidase [Dasania phycosphaerae]MCZ0869812.1 oxygen-independent coproporphyrinogen III oxidase [Dasania phycosphaerae]
MSNHASLTSANASHCGLIKPHKYDVTGPRYTSYPTALQFQANFGCNEYRQELLKQKGSTIAPLSLYVHIPFCHNICYYCACNKIVTRDHSAGRRYLSYLAKEISLQAELVGLQRTVTQLHLGGGTPTFLSDAELTELMHLLGQHFKLSDQPSREYSIEIDPRTVNSDRLALLRGLGFNRLSFGVQDFDHEVQVAINRVQPFNTLQVLTDTARLHQFNSLSFDLIYGLPKQSLHSLTHTLAQVIELAPDRIAFYNYAHLPTRFSSQRAIDRQALPTAEQRLAMLALIETTLSTAGYCHIGMDHFVKPDDELAIAQQEGRLQRNFQGYSTCLAPDLIGLGVSSISSLAHSYAQNEKDLERYYERLDNQQLAIARGLTLSHDDHIRRQVISQLICNRQLNIKQLEKQFQIDFKQYFNDCLETLKYLQKDGLILMESDKIRVTLKGRPLLRNICMTFDNYLNHDSQSHYSSTL